MKVGAVAVWVLRGCDVSDDVEWAVEVVCFARWCVRGKKKEWSGYPAHGVVCWCCIHEYCNTVDS